MPDRFHGRLFHGKSRWVALVLVALLAAALLFVAYQESRNRGPQLFNAFYKPYPAVVGLPNGFGERSTYHKQLRQALRHYSERYYAQASQQFIELTTKRPENDTLNFFIGLSYIGRGEVASAQAYLAKVAVQPESPLQDDAQWYLALAHLQQGRIEAAEQLLESIVQESENNVIASRARRLLGRL
jgi:predicted Zn-dependent protease